MRKNKTSTRLTALLLVVLMLAMLAPSPAAFADEKPMLTLSDQVPGEFGAVPERVSGANRYETAVAISQESWTTSEYVLLATGEGWADALIANPLASALGAPILLTPTDYLHASVWAEIVRLGASKVIILGGEGVVSQQVVTDLIGNGIPAGSIERLGGRDRYDTAARVAERVMIHTGRPQQVVVATGESYPDALAIAGYAARKGYPILLTRPGSLPAATAKEIDIINPQSAVVVGGQGAVSSTVASRLPEPTRIGGTNRYDTAAQIAEYAFRNGMTYETVVLATGEGYADALAAGPWVAKTQGMLALTATAELSTETDDFFNSHCTSIEEIYVAGGPGAVQDGVVSAVREAAGTKMNADEIEVVSTAAESALETISPDGTLTFDDTVDYSSLNTSDVILGKPSASAPNGYLRRVVSVTEAGGKVSVETTLATLADVILKGSIDVTGSVPAEQPETQGALSVTDAEAVDGTHVDVDFDSMQMQAARVDPEVRIGHAFFSYDRNFYENNGLTIRGEGWVDFTADFNIHANFGIVKWHKAWWGWWPEYGLREFSAVAYVRETMVVHLLSQLQMIDYENEIELPKINLPTVTVWAGPVPIVFVNSITPVLGVSASAQANIDVGIGHWAGCSLGVYYNRWSGWHPVQSFWSGYNFTVAGAVEANAKAWIGARLDIMLYGAAGPYFQPQAFLEFDASTAANPWWTFDAGLEVEYGGRIDILGRRANVGWAWELARKRLGNAPGAFPSSREAAPGDFSASGTLQPSGDVVEGMPMAQTMSASQEHVMPAISSSIVPESVEASDFTIDGLTVTDATVIDADTVRLTTTVQDPAADYTVTVADGAVLSDDGAASVSSGGAFQGYYELPIVEYVNPVDGTHVDVFFDTYQSDLDAATVDAGDFSVTGLTVTDATIQPDGTTVRLTTDAQTAGAATTVTVAADALADQDGLANEAGEERFTGYATYSLAGATVSPSNKSVFAMRGISDTIAYGTGMEGYVYKTTNGGATWTNTAGRASWNSYNLAFPDPSDPNLVMTSAFGGYLNRSTNGGASWTEMNLSAWIGHCEDIDFAGSTGKGIAVDGGNLLKSTNYGASWAVHPETGTMVGLCIRFADDTRGYIGGTSGRIWRTDNGGDTWTQLSTPAFAGNITDVWSAADDPDHIVATGTSGYVLVSFDGGETWSTPTSGVAETLLELDFASQDLGFASGESGSVLVTRDGGRSWSTIGSSGGTYLSGIWARDALNIWFGGLNGNDFKATGS